jgi:hypothetical protein
MDAIDLDHRISMLISERDRLVSELKEANDRLSRLRSYFGDDLDDVWVEVVTRGMRLDRSPHPYRMREFFGAHVDAESQCVVSTKYIGTDHERRAFLCDLFPAEATEGVGYIKVVADFWPGGSR